MSTHDSKPVADEFAPPKTADTPTSSSMPTWFPRALRLTIGYVLGTLALLWFFNQARDLFSTAELALDAKGRFLALRVDCVANVGAYMTLVAHFCSTLHISGCLPTVYDIPLASVRTR